MVIIMKGIYFPCVITGLFQLTLLVQGS